MVGGALHLRPCVLRFWVELSYYYLITCSNNHALGTWHLVSAFFVFFLFLPDAHSLACLCFPIFFFFGCSSASFPPNTHQTVEMKGVVITLAVAAAGLSSTEARLTQPAHTTLQLSEARRAVGGTSSGGAVVFAGGCASEQNVYVCDVPSDAVDIFEPSGETTPDAKAGFVRVKTTLSLSTARGWPTVCSSNGVVAVLGGGKEGQQPHSRALDLLDVSARTLTTNETSLSIGLWGQGCATVGDSIIFGGGKIIAEGTLKPSMTDAVHQLAPGADGKPRADGLSTVGRLSLAREASGTTNYGSSGIIFAGGTGPWPPISVPIVDVYDVPFNAPEPTATWDVNSIKPTENECVCS